MNNLYLITRTDIPDGPDWDTYDSFVVCAPSMAAAKQLTVDKFARSCEWVEDVKDLKGRRIGAAHRLTRVGVVLGSFNAG